MSKNNRIKITVTGPTGSGKTTIMRDVMECLGNLGYTVSVNVESSGLQTVLDRPKLHHARARLMLEERQHSGELAIELEECTTAREV